MLEESNRYKKLNKLIEEIGKGITLAIIIFVVGFIIIAIFCARDAYGNTWTIDNGKFKEIYDDRDDCIKTNLGTGTTEKCDDESQVIYKNK